MGASTSAARHAALTDREAHRECLVVALVLDLLHIALGEAVAHELPVAFQRRLEAVRDEPLPQILDRLNATIKRFRNAGVDPRGTIGIVVRAEDDGAAAAAAAPAPAPATPAAGAQPAAPAAAGSSGSQTWDVLVIRGKDTERHSFSNSKKPKTP